MSTSRRGHPGFCIFIDTFFQGPTVAVTEGEGVPCIFQTERAAQLEIADSMLMKLEQFIDGERDFADAIQIDEYVVPVWVQPDGAILDEAGNPVTVAN